MAAVPGSAGLPVIGDKSMEFYRNAVAFVDKYVARYKSRVFHSRLLNKYTIFVASHAGVRSVLQSTGDGLDMGYKSLMMPVYGDNLVFSEGKEAEILRMILRNLLGSDSEFRLQQILTEVMDRTLATLQSGTPVSLYPFFKRLCTEICLSLFLDLDAQKSTQLTNDVVQLSTAHWHGIISVPVSIRVPGLTNPSSYSQALAAKEKLLQIIQTRLQEADVGFAAAVAGTTFPAPQHAANHILLFCSALVPKALASILTSFTLATASEVDQTTFATDPRRLENFLLETQRLWPPFFGGRRLVRRDMQLNGYLIPAGSALVYMTRHAQRDPQTFPDPDNFNPERWNDSDPAKAHEQLFLFGGGARSCIGSHLVAHIMRGVVSRLAAQFSWTVDGTPDSTEYKWLPVSRPKEDIQVTFSRRETDGGSRS